MRTGGERCGGVRLTISRSMGCIVSSVPSLQASWSTGLDSTSAFVNYNICNVIAPGAYTGATFATQLQRARNYESATTGNNVTCTYQPDDEPFAFRAPALSSSITAAS